jgi:hypothetical protein
MRIEVHDMVRAAVIARGCDGLCNCECGCGLHDLMPCGDGFTSCEAARYVAAADCDACGDECEGGCYQPVEFEDDDEEEGEG